VITPFWSTVATAALLVLHVGVLPLMLSPLEFRRRAVAVIVVPTCIVGDGAATTIAVTVVGEGPVGPSLLHAARATDTTANARTLFMSTLPERESAAPEGRHCEIISDW
jgi:hypothetical protein